jgi:quinol monooxygenase YgiN
MACQNPSFGRKHEYWYAKLSRKLAGSRVCQAPLGGLSTCIGTAIHAVKVSAWRKDGQERRVTMGDQISWRVELAVKPGQLENFRVLTGEMVEFTRGEPGVLSYERFVTDDGKFVHVHERYVDSAAALAHLRIFGEKFSERFLNMVDRTRFTVVGNPSKELRGVLERIGATFLKPFGDFAYWA